MSDRSYVRIFSAVIMFGSLSIPSCSTPPNNSSTPRSDLVPEVADCQESPSFPGLSRDIRSIERNKGDHFPKDQFTISGADGVAFETGVWYKKHLQAMSEPPLLDMSADKAEVYRFLWLRTFHRPIAVRIERNSVIGDADLVITELDGKGGYEPGAIIRHEKIRIHQIHWCEFQNFLDKAEFWKMSDSIDLGGPDGSQWILEGLKDNRYHVVDRWSPEDGVYREACLRLLRMAGFNSDLPENEIY